MLNMRYEPGSPDILSEFTFRTNNNLINKSDIRDYQWGYVEQFNKVKAFTRSLSTHSIPVTFYQRRSGSENELYTIPEKVYAMFDRDVMMNTQGKLWIEKEKRKGYYINCYIIGSKKSEYDNGVVIKTTFTILSDFKWHKEMSRSFGDIQPSGEGEFLDYQYDHEYDYGTSANITSIMDFQNEAIAPFDFKIVFHGPWETPIVTVGGQIYRVYTSVDNDEKLIVDSLRKVIYKTNENDEYLTNEFVARDRENYIFQKMPVSNNKSEVEVPDGKTVDITAYIERSEPPWI